MKEDKEYEKVIKKLYEDYPINELLQFDDTNIKERLQNNAYLILQYKGLWLKEKNELELIGKLRDKIIGEQFNQYRFNDKRELKPAEIKEYYIPSDTRVIRINRLYQKQQWRVDFFWAASEALIQMGWRMKSFLDEKRIS